jgi:hypothetical protein
LTPAAEAHIAEFETALAVVLAGQLN